MNYKLGQTLTEVNTEKVGLTTEELDSLKSSIEQLNNITSKLSAEIVKCFKAISDLSTSTNNQLTTLESDLEKQIAGVNTKVDNLDLNPQRSFQQISAASVSASELKASTANLTNAKMTSMDTVTGTVGTLNATAATVTGLETDTLKATDATLTKANIENASIKNLSQEVINCNELNALDVISDRGNFKDSLFANKIQFGYAEEIAVRVTDNTKLARLRIYGDVVILHSMRGEIVVTPNGVLSNNKDLYAVSYDSSDGESGAKLYFDSDLDLRVMSIGVNPLITQAVVAKDNIQRNTDSNGAVNNGSDIKVAVVSKLPSIGMKNMIYIVIGDCSYYSDGNNYYAMTSKYSK